MALAELSDETFEQEFSGGQTPAVVKFHADW